MKTLPKNLPFSLCPINHNPDGLKYQTIFLGYWEKNILLSTSEIIPVQKDDPVRVELFNKKDSFSFKTSVMEVKDDYQIILSRPEEIQKNRLREGRRVQHYCDLIYTVWKENPQYNARLIDISETGVRFLSRRPHKQGEILSISLYIRDAKVRIIGQGLVAWCKLYDERGYFEVALRYTTVSNSIRARLSLFINSLPDGKDSI